MASKSLTGAAKLVLALLTLSGAVSANAQTRTGPATTGPVQGATPPSPTDQNGPAGAPSLTEPTRELRAAYDEAFKLTLQNPSDPETLAKFAGLAIQLGDIEGAISALERLLLIDGDQAEVKLELGVLYFRIGSNEAARMYLESARTSKEATAEVKQKAEAYLKAIPKT